MTSTKPQLAARKLIANLRRTRNELSQTLELLESVETALCGVEPAELEAALIELNRQTAACAQLADQRQTLLSELGIQPGEQEQFAAFLQALPPEDGTGAVRVQQELRTQMAAVTRRKHRVWNLLTTRAAVVNTTLGVISGGAAGTYQANGAVTQSCSQPLLQRRC